MYSPLILLRLVTKHDVWKGLNLRIAFGSIPCLSKNFNKPTTPLIMKLGIIVRTLANLSVPFDFVGALTVLIASSIFSLTS